MKKSGGTSAIGRISNKKTRPGIHAKTKKSVNKRGKHWKKEYRGQGR
jgi:hypothetical protein